jgi:hypothetical protein
MRALTFPSHTNDRGESYDFGFGMSHAGFSNIVTVYDATNIPDWIILESGDPAKELGKPVTYVEFEGQGHGISGLGNQVTYYQARFNFLQDVVCEACGSSVPECEQ